MRCAVDYDIHAGSSHPTKHTPVVYASVYAPHPTRLHTRHIHRRPPARPRAHPPLIPPSSAIAASTDRRRQSDHHCNRLCSPTRSPTIPSARDEPARRHAR